MTSSPYPGMRPFKDDEAEIFFGREKATAQLLNQLNQSRLVAVIGPSGAGKSSLVNAGVLASLGSNPKWRIIKCRPGSRPLREFVCSLRQILGLENQSITTGERDADSISSLVNSIQTKKIQALSEIFDEICLSTFSNLLISIDQFDELFRYSQYIETEEINGFISLLLELVAQEEWPIYVILSLRSDYLGHCNHFKGLFEEINNGQFITPHFTDDELKEAILRPALNFHGKVEPALADLFFHHVKSAPRQLPVVQHSLMRLWNEVVNASSDNHENILTIQAYNKLGGLEHTLCKHAEEVFENLPLSSKKIAEFLFRALCKQDDKYMDLRRPVVYGQLLKSLKIPMEDLAAVIKAFRDSDRNFIHSSPRKVLSQGTVIDISHECLIWGWTRFDSWMEKEEQAQKIYQHLEHTACYWKESKAALLGSPDLENILEWKNHENWNSHWSKRYGNHWDLAIDFLNESEKTHEENLKRAAKDRKQESWRIKKQIVWIFATSFIMYYLFAWGLNERNQAKTGHQQISTIQNQFQMSLQKAQSKFADTTQKTQLKQQKISEALDEIQELKKDLLKEENLRIEAQKIAKEAEIRAFQAEKQRSTDLFEFQITHARLMNRSGDYLKARTILSESRTLDHHINPNRKIIRNLLDWYTQTVGDAPEKSYSGIEAPIKSISLNPSGPELAAAGENGKLLVLNTKNGKIIHDLNGHTGDVRQVLFHSQKKWIISGGDDGRIIFWSLQNGDKLQEWDASAKVVALTISPDGEFLVSGGTDHNILIWRISTNEIIKTFTGHTDSIASGGLCYSPDSQFIASASYDKTVRIWDMQSHQTVKVLKGHTDRVEAVAFGPNTKLFASSSSDHTIRLWDIETGQTNRVLKGHSNAVLALFFVDNGKQLISTSIDRTLRIWDTDSGVTLGILQGHTSAVTDVAYKNNEAFSSGNNGSINRWNLKTYNSMRIFDAGEEPLSIAIAPNGTTVAIGYSSGDLTLHSLPNFELIWKIPVAHGNYINRIAFSPDSQLIASCSYDNTIKLWNIKDGKKVKTLKDHEDAIYCLAFSNDGKRLASAGFDGRIGLYDMDIEEFQYIGTKNRKNYSVAFNSDGTKLLSCGDDNRTKLWNLNSDPPKIVRSFPRSQNLIMWSAISPNEELVASVGRDVLINIYDGKNGAEISHLVGHENTIYRAKFSPDGSHLATVSADATVKMWDMENQTELFSIRLPTNSGWPIPLWDFSFEYTRSPENSSSHGWIAIPLFRGKLVLFDLGNPYKF